MANSVLASIAAWEKRSENQMERLTWQMMRAAGVLLMLLWPCAALYQGNWLLHTPSGDFDVGPMLWIAIGWGMWMGASANLNPKAMRKSVKAAA